MNIALWIAQWLLALGFVGAGTFKLVAYNAYVEMVTQQRSQPAGRGLAAFIGIAEIAGGIGVVAPMALNIFPSLSVWAAFGLASIMLLAIGYHLRGKESAPAPIVLLALAVFVAFGRSTLVG